MYFDKFNKRKLFLTMVIVSLLLMVWPGKCIAQGRLLIQNGKIISEDGTPFVIKGVSTHGLAWFPQYVNRDAFKSLRDTMGVNTIRLALYTEEYGGYCSGGDKTELKKLVDRGVQAASDLDMYVIIDWHILWDGNPLKHKKQANAFFSYAARKYQNNPHVIYEICNEPNGSGGSWKNIKKYAQSVIGTIRKYDRNALIIVGTPTWSQDVDIAMGDPITGYTNLAYAFHFYAGTHQEAMRVKLENVLRQNFPVIVSEFGISDASGNGGINTAQGRQWMNLLDRYSVGRVCWSLSNKAESSALLKPSCKKVSGFKNVNLSRSGKWLKKVYR